MPDLKEELEAIIAEHKELTLEIQAFVEREHELFQAYHDIRNTLEKIK